MGLEQRLLRAARLALLTIVAWLSGRSQADTHVLGLPEWPHPGWSVETRVEGQDVRFVQEGTTGDATIRHQVILYTAPKQVEVSVYANFTGNLPEGVQPVSLTLEIHEQTGVTWAVAGGVATAVVDLSTNRELAARIISLQGRAVLHTTDPLWTPTASFSADLYIARPITVTASGATGGSLWIHANSQEPYIRTNTAGLRWVDYRGDLLPGAQVKAEPLEGVQCSSGWLATDDISRAMAVVWAPTSSEPDAAGFVHGRVRLKAVKDRATAEREMDIRIPYASVVSANGATLVGRAGAIMEPRDIVGGDVLKPGDVVQVGNELIWSGPYLTVRFCNGQQLTLQDFGPGGLRAVVGQGSFDHRTSVLQVTLQNAVQDIRSDPRRYGRMVIYKALGNAVDGFLGIPDPVGWVATTPGGALENWLADYVESAYQPRQLQGPVTHAGGPHAGDPSPTDAPWVASEVNFFSDGTARVYNRGGALRVQGPAASAVLPRGAMSIARLDVPGGAVSALGQAPVSGFAPLVNLNPSEGATDVPPRPDLEVRVGEFGGNEVLPGGLSARVDGVLLRTSPREENRYLLTLPPGMALASGAHQWDVELALSGGGIVRTSVTFQVTSNLPPPQGVRAAAGAQRVALRWDDAALAWARGGFRVYRSAPGGVRQLVSGTAPLREPNFVDPAPVAGAAYEVAGLDADGREGSAGAGVNVTFPGPAPATPRAVSVVPELLENGAGLALAIEDPTPGFTLWRIEAGPTADGPFTDVLNGELTSRTPWPIPNPFAETRRWFRVTAVNVDGGPGPSVLVGPLDLPLPLPPVVGLTASPNPDGSALLRWNPWTTRALAGYRVERWAGGAWQTAAEVGPEVAAWTDASPASGELRQWRVRARLAGGAESPASSTVALRTMTVPANPGVVRFATGTASGLEGETVALPVIREGGLDLPAFVTWSTWRWNGTATPEQDFTPGGGLLIFAPGEAQKVISIPLLTDAEAEQQDEFFYVHLLGVEGGAALGEPSAVQVSIAGGAKVSWEQIWLYGQEGLTAEVAFNVILTRPSAQEVRVDFQFDPERSTATPDADFTGPLSGTLVFAPGQTNRSFTITIVNDSLKEGTAPENVVFRLLNPQGAALDDSDPFRVFATLQIGDDDTRPGSVVFADRTLRLREGQSRTLTLRREGGTDGALEVFIFPVSGTATQEQDWTIAPGFPRFEDGQTEATVTFTALVDGRAEGAEVVVLNLHGGMGPGQGSSLLVIIADLDGAASGFTAWAEQALGSQPPALRAATADADGDSLPNWLEFLWRTDPTRSDRPALPETTLNEWGEWQVRVTVREDAGAVVWAEFAEDALWSRPTFDAGTWQSNGDGTRTGTFRYFNFGGQSGFVRLRAEWLANP